MTDHQTTPAAGPVAENWNPWPHRLVWLMALSTVALISFGAMVTTYEAGMAVYDWPTTFGFNMFLVPLERWIPGFGGAWGVFLEHGHRLIGSWVGMVAIAVAVAMFFLERRRWLFAFSLVVLGLVCAQGYLGGARVIQNAQTLAMVHGTTAPLVFAAMIVLLNCSSRFWATAQPVESYVATGFRGLSVLLAVGLYVQIGLGAWLRHFVDARAMTLHLWTPVALAALTAILTIYALAAYRRQAAILWPTLAVAGLFVVQTCIGLATWVAIFPIPDWVAAPLGLVNYVPRRFGPEEVIFTTLHVVTGAALLASSVTVAVRSLRLLRSVPQQFEIDDEAEARPQRHVPGQSTESAENRSPQPLETVS